ncbi:hypothetical protein [Enterovirga rhinocerotis]|uniref:Uncharacterized protein n=1 Tax=Enterovirga rhinocerotis TaxID=1339210 RepID=A0A4R7BWS7_9HYPH|nr:hypothetical protein [Enterovirga rhinocerotis]TDR90031.1 hypothetical protein EV668_2869 [Enterovirga rhinocerotis]
MEIPNTPENRVLAGAVNARIKADARILNAKAAFWRLAGWALVCAMIGIGVGAALVGWTYSRGGTEAVDSEKVARAVAAALGTVTLKTEGTVKLDPESRLAASPPAEVPRPTEGQLGQGQQPASQGAVNTAFTVFKTVPHAGGHVVTGWNFESSEQKAPGRQYCYYSEQIDGGAKITVDLGEDGRQNMQARSRGAMDPANAWTNCVWFRTGAL